MKILFLSLIICLFYGCSKSNDTKHTTCIEIDTTMLNVQLRNILHKYVVQHPQYKSNAIYTDLLETWDYKTQNTYISIEPLVHADFARTNSRQRGCPKYYISCGNYKFFLVSRLDNLFVDSLTSPIIRKYAIKKIAYLRGKEGWYVEITNKIHYNIIANHCADVHFDTISTQRMMTNFSANH